MAGAIIDEPHRGAIGDLRGLQSPGLETFRRHIRGELPPPPISRLLGLRPTEVMLGRITFTMPITRWLEDGFGVYEGGVFALLADAALSGAIYSAQPAGHSVTTSELNMSFVRPLSRSSGSLVGRAGVVHSGTQVGLSTVLLTDPEGRTVSFGSSRCLIVDMPIDRDVEFPPPETGPDQPADPHLREPPDGFYLSPSQASDGVPIELQREIIAGRLWPPIWQLTGFEPVAVEDGTATTRLPTSPWFSLGGPAIYGGMVAWAAEATMAAANYSTLPAGDFPATLDMNIRFARPALVNSGGLTMTAGVTHRGRRLRMMSCEVTNAEGKRVALASSSALVVPYGARDLAKGLLPADIVQARAGN